MAAGESQFGGVAGRVLRRAFRRSTWISGMVLAAGLILTARGLGSIDRFELLPVAAIPLWMLGLAYHGVRVAAGAGFERTVGRTIVVALRAALASAAWLGPWFFWGASLGSPSTLPGSIGAPSPVAAGLYLFACLFATPVILIAAVHSRRWLDLLSPFYWAERFRGRGGDLLIVYTIQTGGIVLAAGICLPIVLGLLGFNSTAGLTAAAIATCAVLGFWTSLTGRLCGSIHATSTAVEAAVRAPRFDEGMILARSALDSEYNRDRPARAGAEPQRGEEPSGFRQDDDDPEDRTREGKIERYAKPAKSIAFDEPMPKKNKSKTPLLDAQARTAEAMKRFRLDPSYTLSKLAELNQNFAPNAHVLQALAICLHRTGHNERALSVAREGFRLCFERGYVSLAAAMFYEFRGRLQSLDLKQDEVLAIANVLHEAEELAAAAKAYSLVVHTNPNEVLAVKGLLDVADGILNKRKKPAAALKVYEFLLEHCRDASMTAMVRDGIRLCAEAEAEKAKEPEWTEA